MIRRRGDTWQWRVRLKGFPTQYGTCRTKGCAEACASRRVDELRQGKSLSKMLVSEAIDLYVADYLPKIADSAPHYLFHLKLWRKELGAYALTGVTPQVVRAARDRLRDRGGVIAGGHGSKRPARPVSNSTLNRYVTTLASLYSWAMEPERRLADRNPAHDVERLEEPKERVRFLSRPVDEEESEFARLMAACKESDSPILYDLVCILLGTACRSSEILELERREIRLSEGGFTIPAERAKTEHPRFVALEGIALEAVQRRLKVPRLASKYLFPGLKPGTHATFPSRAWRTALKRAGITNFRGHDLRHSHLSYGAMMGKSIPELQAAGGHRSVQSLMRYVHLADEAKRKVSRDVNEQMSGWAHDVKRPS